MSATATKLTFSPETLEVLKNYASINSNILVKPGNKLTTVSPVKNVMAEAVVPETFDTEFGIWDLNKFLGVISLFKNPSFTFEDKYVLIEENDASVKYFFSDPSLLTTVNREIKMPETVLSFNWNPKAFGELMKAAAVMQLPDFCIRNDGDMVEAVVLDKADASSNHYAIELGEVTWQGNDFEFFFKVENIKILPGEYTVNITEKVVSEFIHTKRDIKYYIALESDSRYNG